MTTLKAPKDGCAREQLMRTQRLLKGIHTKNADDDCTNDLDACAKRTLLEIRRHVRTVDNELARMRCVDPTFTVLTALRDGLKAPASADYEAIKAFGAAPLPDEDNRNTKLDLVKAYNDIAIAFRRNNVGCFKNQMAQTQRVLETIHAYFVEKCATNYNSNCFKRIIRTINTHTDTVDNEIENSKCSDPTYLSIYNAIHEGMTLPNTIRVESVRLFGQADLTQDTFDFAQIYKDIDQLGDQYAPCLSVAVPTILSNLDDVHRSVQRCADDACFKTTLDQFRKSFNGMEKRLKASKCSCSSFDPIREKIRGGFQLASPLLIDAIKTYATTDVVDTTFDLVDIYMDLIDAVKEDKDSCFLAWMQKTKVSIEGAHNDADECSRTSSTDAEINTCYLAVVDKFRSFFNTVESDLKGARCADNFFDPIRTKIRVGLKLLDATLIDSLKTFADTSITSADFTLADVYKDLTQAVNDNNFGCQKNFMIQAQKTLENTHNTAENCPETDAEQTACYKDVLKTLQVSFLMMEDKLKDNKCVDPVFTPIRSKLRDAMKLPEDSLLNGIRTYANTAIDSERTTPQFRKSNEAAVTGLEGCFKDEMQKIQKAEQLFQVDAQRCSEFMKATEAAACYNSAYTKANEFFAARGGVQCFNTIVSPLKSDLDNLLSKVAPKEVAPAVDDQMKTADVPAVPFNMDDKLKPVDASSVKGDDDDSESDAPVAMAKMSMKGDEDVGADVVADTVVSTMKGDDATAAPKTKLRRKKKKVAAKVVTDDSPKLKVSPKFASAVAATDDTVADKPMAKKSFADAAKAVVKPKDGGDAVPIKSFADAAKSATKTKA